MVCSPSPIDLPIELTRRRDETILARELCAHDITSLAIRPLRCGQRSAMRRSALRTEWFCCPDEQIEEPAAPMNALDISAGDLFRREWAKSFDGVRLARSPRDQIEPALAGRPHTFAIAASAQLAAISSCRTRT